MPALNTATLADRVAFHIIKGMEEQKRIDHWKAFDRRALKRELLFFDKVRKLFRRQRAEVNARLDTLRGAVIAAGYTDRTTQVVLSVLKAITKADDPIEPLLFRREEWGVTFQNEMTPLIEETVSSSGVQALSDVMVSVEFDVTNPRVARFIQDKAFKFSFEVNDTTLRQLRKSLSQGVTRGESIYRLQKRVKHVFDIAETSRAVRIARTEVIGAANFGTFEGYKQSGVVEKKEWLSVKDARTRDSHASMDGQVVALESAFSNGLMYPGDMNGPPEAIINCRCSTIAVVGEVAGQKRAEEIREDLIDYAEINEPELQRIQGQIDNLIGQQIKAEAAGNRGAAFGFESQAENLREEYMIAREQIRKQMLQLIDAGQKTESSINLMYVGNFSYNEQVRMQPAIDALEKIVKRVNTKTDSIIVTKTAKTRAYFQGNTMYIPRQAKFYPDAPAQMLHEVGHWIEKNDEEFAQKVKAFFKSRTARERSKRLGGRYAKDEIFRKDKFIDPYMGKVYKKGQTEITSMGLDYLYKDPYALAKGDPEYFDFLVNTLRGIE